MEAILGPLFPLSFFAFFVAERVRPGRPMPTVRRWTAKGLTFFGIALLVNVALPPVVAGRLAPFAPFDLGGLGVVGGAIVTFFATSLADYGLHRAMHRFPTVWRWSHQLHHSAERVDMAGFVYAHPTEMVAAVLISTVVGTLVGASADAVMLAGYAYYVVGLVQHVNVKTPVWLGWFVQRPEGHLVHHTRGVHAYNYGLPLWDAVFGTRRNPADWDETYGFWDGASAEVLPMLAGRDVGTPPAGEGLRVVA